MTDDNLQPDDRELLSPTSADEVNADIDPAGEELATDLDDPGTYEIVADELEAEELVDASDEVDATPDSGDPDDVVIDDPEQLKDAETTAAKARSSRPIKRTPAAAGAASTTVDNDDVDADNRVATPSSKRPVKKSTEKTSAETAATKKSVERKPRPKTAPRDARKRTTPAQFVAQSVGELRKVNWPTGDQLRQYFVVVLFFVLAIIIYVGLIDLGLGWAILKLFGAETPQ